MYSNHETLSFLLDVSEFIGTFFCINEVFCHCSKLGKSIKASLLVRSFKNSANEITIYSRHFQWLKKHRLKDKFLMAAILIKRLEYLIINV